MTGVDGDGHGSHGGNGLHQGALLAARDVYEAGVVGGVELGVVVARPIILDKKKGEEEGSETVSKRY